MISSLIGSVIMTAVTVTMLIALNIINKGLSSVGKYPLTQDEITIWRDAGYKDPLDIENINQEIKNLDFDVKK